MDEQGVMVEVGGGKMAMASSSTSNGTLPSEAAPLDYLMYPPPLATYEEVVASPQLFMETLEKLHASMGTKFKVPVVGGRILDLHRLFLEVTYRGGLAKIVQEKKWKDVTGIFSFPSSATNASFILRKYYYSLLLHYEQVYFFKAEGWSPNSIGIVQNGSEVTAPNDAPTEPVLSSAGTQEATLQVQREKSAKLISEATSTPSTGSPVLGVIDGKFESGYLITVKIGSEQFKGVLYQASADAAHQEQHHRSSQQYQSVSVNNNNDLASTSRTVRRRRRKKSEIRKRDPAHPKPNRSGYNFFFAELHAKLKPLYPGKDREISRMIGESWTKLKESEKSIYQEKAIKDKERYRIEMEGYRQRLRMGQTNGNVVPIQVQPHETYVNLMNMDKKLQTEDANSNLTPEFEMSSNKSENSNTDLHTVQTKTDATPLQLHRLEQDVNLMNLEKKFQTELHSTSTPENETSSNLSEKSNLDLSTMHIASVSIPVEDQSLDPIAKTTDQETNSNLSDKINLDLSTGQTISDAIPVQDEPIEPNVKTMDQEPNSSKNEISNLDLVTMQNNKDSIPVQQQPLEPYVKMTDQEEKIQSESALYSPENEISSNKSDKYLKDSRSVVMNAEMEVSRGVEVGLENSAMEILADEETFESRKRTNKDADEDEECDAHTAVEIKKKRISVPVEGKILASGEEREVVPSEVEESLPSH